ncbi:MAG: DUF4395 family protein [Actinomycetota bacterium]
MATIAPRTAHPYDETGVIDARAPRFNQATVTLLCAAALVTGWWPLASLMGLQLAVGLFFGRRYCLPCLFYFEVVQPRTGEGEIEDARPPRFANIMGVAFLTAATLAHFAGLALLGWVLIALVAALAGLAAATGLCVGCELYRLLARARGIRPGSVERLDLEGLDAPSGTDVVHFTHPLCGGCHEVQERLAGEGRVIAAVDISNHPELARRYHVAVVPTTYEVAPDGSILARLA